MTPSPKINSRFIKSIVTTAKETQTEMPWERGATRLAMIARRRVALKSSLRSA
ncbi:hypothetical protein [Pelagimonas varians]|uniref:Uncharacterized protein n=1 Tax=Pelagimonas varians TaxID=696760 RepID=A0A238KAJ3_9RHOB|nr:hypothetical protein [Pelagimonas varians]PYG31199.1 hypothetical protein C8N36_105259 [Pelagimonas varians]SMX39835.1 hypothetical protein PEV8663_01899 [Pelagimonas varians]